MTFGSKLGSLSDMYTLLRKRRVTEIQPLSHLTLKANGNRPSNLQTQHSYHMPLSIYGTRYLAMTGNLI